MCAMQNQQSQSWQQWTNQLEAYVRWVNSQLRKQTSNNAPGVNIVTDLRHDMADGTVLANLLQVLDGDTVVGINTKPECKQDMKDNVERLLSFMAKKGIVVPKSVSVRDIIDGNMKCIMRLVQAIATHYKPSCITTSSTGNEHAPQPEQRSSQQRQYNREFMYYTLPRNSGVNRFNNAQRTTEPESEMLRAGGRYSDIENNNNASEDDNNERCTARRQGVVAISTETPSPKLYENWPFLITDDTDDDDVRQVDGASCASSPCSSVVHDTRRTRTFIDDLNTTVKRFNEFEESLETYRTTNRKSVRARLLSRPSDDKDLKCLVDIFKAANHRLMKLQRYVLHKKDKEMVMLLNSDTCEKEVQVSLPSPTCERCQARGTSSDDNSSDKLRELTERLEQEMGSHEITRKECDIVCQRSEKLQQHNKDLMKRVESKDDEIIKLQVELNSKDQLIKRQRSQFDETLKNLSAANKVKTNLTNRIAEQDKKIAKLELQTEHGTHAVASAMLPFSRRSQQSREEVRIVRDALQSLRRSFASNQPEQHTIDTVDQSIATLIERLHIAQSQMHSMQPSPPSDGGTSENASQQLRTTLAEEASEGWTKVVYFTERAVTPYLLHLPKRIGEITLAHFKEAFDRHGSYRYHFKSIDPEFGMVKEELVNDEDVLPGIDGKIIAWVEEDI